MGETGTMAEELTEDDKAERAREFRVTLNRRRPSRKRYSFSSQFLQSAAIEQTTSLAGDSSELSRSLTLSTGTLSDGIPLHDLGGESIYREIDERESLSKWRNAMSKAVPQPIRKALLPPLTWEQWKKFVLVHLPVLDWLSSYRPKQLIGDVIAGVTIGVTHIPQGKLLHPSWHTSV